MALHPYTYAVAAGSVLPAGITLSSTGNLSGTANSVGNYSFGITARDSGTGVVQTATATYTLAVTPGPSSQSPRRRCPGGVNGSPYSASLASVGGVPPYSYSIQSGALPAGITLAPSGVFLGRPTANGPFTWIVRLLARQGISNRAAEVFLDRRGSPTFAEIADLMDEGRCSRLLSYWSFADCGYRRNSGTCGTPHNQPGCPVTVIPARKGALAEAALGLWLFVRDVCDGDIVTWIDARLAAADPGRGATNRAASMRAALIDPLVNIAGTGPKIWSMILAELLLGADPHRERWVTTGASFIAVDSLVHAHLHRTGILRRLDAEHAYGPRCHAPGGCAAVIAGLAARIDAGEFNAGFPACFPRWVQFALWWFCAADGWSICNSVQIDDRRPCEQLFCPAFRQCNKIVIKPYA